MLNTQTLELLRHLSTQPGHDEVKADFRDLLVREFGVELGALDFERRVPEVQGRLDALIGRTVFEAKSNLDREWPDVERRLPQYLADREREEGQRFVGIASDGRKWAVFELSGGALVKLKETILDPDKGEAFLAWLDGALALKGQLKPDALTVRAELGQESVAYHLVDAQLRDLWKKLERDPAEALKRQLWADLLQQVYGRKVESDSLWFQHTYLVIVAKCIALAVMQLYENDPERLLSGKAFSDAGIHGAVESDFFDWVIADQDGIALVRRIMAHVRRFRLSEVEIDVMKVLYESLIDRDERHGLGEYYTPDWLAAKVVRHAVDRPLEQRVLDPACGSGAFLFHAVRNLLAEAEEAGLPKNARAAEACALVAGLDVHPVAVIIARVTYLLALVPALHGRSGSLSIPVYLGDAMQMSIRDDVLMGRELVIRVPPPPAGEGESGEAIGAGREQLDFPDTFCRDPGLFDKAIERIRTASLTDMSREQVEAALVRITEQHYKADLSEEQRLAIGDLGKTYQTFDRLRREGRDTIWAYVARNLSRPLALSAAGGWAHVLVGNPPWVAYRHMSADLQKRFKGLAVGAKVYVGGRFATQSDLSALFTVRASQLYLRPSGKIAFVLPLAALTRGQFEKLRSGRFDGYNIAWDDAWTMDDSVGPLFPVPSCVVFGRKRAIAKAIPERVRAYSGWLPIRDAPESIADARLTVKENAPAPAAGNDSGGSEYRGVFKNGATLYPRMLCLIERVSLGRLGPDPSAPLVVSRRVAGEKAPWSEHESVEAAVEEAFLRPVLLGESILPYRVLNPFEGIIPFHPKFGLMSSRLAANPKIGFDKLASWMAKSEAVWDELKAEGTRLTLAEQLDYHGKLSSQFPIPPRRIVYSKGGTLPAACIVRDEQAVIDHKLYWASPDTEEEAHFLCAILNSECVRSRAEQYQSRGQFGARDFDKVMFNLPIPRFKADDREHVFLAELGLRAEEAAKAVPLVEGEKFQRARRRIREALIEAAIAPQIERRVTELLDKAGDKVAAGN